jgi:hypothetical protein
MSRKRFLPITLTPLGLSREQAAGYVGISPSKFDEMVADGCMPAAKRIDKRKVYDRRALEEAFDALPGAEDANPWDEMAAS